jgi:acetyl-CoA synthetase
LAGGEPINEKIFKWLYEVVGKKKMTIFDGFGQTELGGGIAISTLSLNATSGDLEGGLDPILGIELVLLDDKGNELSEENSNGHLCIKNPYPTMARTMKNNHEKYLDTYLRPFPGELESSK